MFPGIILWCDRVRGAACRGAMHQCRGPDVGFDRCNGFLNMFALILEQKGRIHLMSNMIISWHQFVVVSRIGEDVAC